MICRKGKYFKFFNNNNNEVQLVFVPEEVNGIDILYNIQKLTDSNGFQAVNDDILSNHFEMLNTSNHNIYGVWDAGTQKTYQEVKFNHLVFFAYTIEGNIIPDTKTDLYFDFEGYKLTIRHNNSEKTYKIKNDNNFTFKFMKTQIKAKNGIEGIYSFITSAMHVDDPFNSTFSNILIKAAEGNF